MAGLQDLIEAYPSLAPVANFFGAKKTVYERPELPMNLQDLSKSDLQKNPLAGIPRSQIPADIPTSIKAFMADPSNKFGGGKGIQTIPLQRFQVGGDKYHPTDPNLETANTLNNSTKANQEIFRYARLAGAASKYGYPTLTPEELTALALQEGRSDFGYNGGGFGKKGSNYSNKLFDEMSNKFNAHTDDLGFMATIADKKRVSEKYGIPFANAWNGTGISDAKKTGKQYAEEWKQQYEVATRPENSQLYDLIRKAYSHGTEHGLPLLENQLQDTDVTKKEVPYRRGGTVDKSIAGNNKLI